MNILIFCLLCLTGATLVCMNRVLVEEKYRVTFIYTLGIGALSALVSGFAETFGLWGLRSLGTTITLISFSLGLLLMLVSWAIAGNRVLKEIRAQILAKRDDEVDYWKKMDP